MKTENQKTAACMSATVFQLRNHMKIYLFEFERACIELIVGAFFGDQAVVVSALDDASVVEHHYRVAVLDR